MRTDFTGNNILTTLTLITLILATFTAISMSTSILTTMPKTAYYFLVGWFILSTLFCLLSYKDFVVGFLVSLFCMMVGWRIAALYHVTFLTYPLLLTFFFFLSNFLYNAWMNVAHPERYIHSLSAAEWQLMFVRIYIGLDFVPHFTEKLFAGAEPHLADVTAFISLSVPHANFFVWLAGLCEFGAAVALALGFFMRIGALGTVLYLLIATLLGHHFQLGFIWASPGGGWEFATMWMILIFSFAFTGIHAFSIDQRMEDKYRIPSFLRKLL